MDDRVEVGNGKTLALRNDFGRRIFDMRRIRFMSKDILCCVARLLKLLLNGFERKLFLR